MRVEDETSWIGYSVFDTAEDCYAYNENACYIASTQQSAREFIDVACADPADVRVDTVSWHDLVKDFGGSSGEYAMEAAAFARFQTLAAQHGVSFEAEAYDGDDSLMVVEM
jgi:hypothetical protein